MDAEASPPRSISSHLRGALSACRDAFAHIPRLALDIALIPFFGASGAAAAASGAYCAGGVTALLLYRARAPFRLRELVIPQPGDFEVLRALAPMPLVRPRPQRS